MSVVDISFQNGLAWVEVNNPPVNATSQAVRLGLFEAVRQVDASNVEAAVLFCSGKTFVAGGDMTEFDGPAMEPHLPDVVAAIESSRTPWIAAMHGTVLGGGLELALGCAYRVAKRDTRFGLPEVNVGLIPGAGGTQRLPRFVPMQLAIDIACWGKVVTAQELASSMLLDAVIEGDLRNGITEFAQALPARPPKPSERLTSEFSNSAFDEERKKLEKKFRGQQSPIHNLNALKFASLPFKEGMKKERDLHLALRKSVESAALRHAFFAERQVARPRLIRGSSPLNITKVAVVGGGLMGAGIAASALLAGYSVTILEQDETGTSEAEKRVLDILKGALIRGKTSQKTYDEQIKSFVVSGSYDCVADHQLAIEAVFEDVNVKRDVFLKLAGVMSDAAILATNTSYLDPQDIFADVPGGDRCIGLHFFSPAHVMRLLEVIQLPSTYTEALATGFAFAKRLGKVPVLSGICDGFIGNRMLASYRREAEYLLADGAAPAEVDAAMRKFGYAMGPFEAQDMGGLQIAWANRKTQASSRNPSLRYCEIADQLCETGRFGQRTGKGWYDYAEGSRKPIESPDVAKIIESYSVENGIERQKFDETDIVERLLAVLANEGALIVEEGIADDEAAVDMVQLHGYGFPRWKGGPMHLADTLGADSVKQALHRVQSQSPNSWKIARKFS